MPPGSLYRSAPCFAELGSGFGDAVAPAAFPALTLRHRNTRWAARVGLGTLSAAEWERHFAAFEPLPDNQQQPLALRYHGHQFRSYNPRLGDGRGFLFAQLRDGCDARLLDLGTKGSGTTPYARGGDGRLTLKGGVRELLATEMLEALGVNTSKTLSLFETGEKLARSDEPSPTRASVLVRLGHSHLRIGTFQRLAHERDRHRLCALLEHAVARYHPALLDLPARPELGLPEAFLAAVSRACAELCASWLAAGFVHGVLNSDNVNITGESFDYGPYRFLPRFDPRFTAAYFDRTGLYSFGRQPEAMRWNVQQLAVSLEPLLEPKRAAPVAAQFDDDLATALGARLSNRLGLGPGGHAGNDELVRRCFDFLQGSEVGYDDFFFDWYGGEASRARALEGPRAHHYRGEPFDLLRTTWERRAPLRPEQLSSAYFQRDNPCRLLIEDVESLWAPIAERDDWQPLAAKLADMRILADAYGRTMVPSREPAANESPTRSPLTGLG